VPCAVPVVAAPLLQKQCVAGVRCVVGALQARPARTHGIRRQIRIIAPRSALWAKTVSRNSCRAGNKKRTFKPSSPIRRPRAAHPPNRDQLHGTRYAFPLHATIGHRWPRRSCADFRTIRRPSRRARQPAIEPLVAVWILRVRSSNSPALRPRQLYASRQNHKHALDGFCKLSRLRRSYISMRCRNAAGATHPHPENLLRGQNHCRFSPAPSTFSMQRPQISGCSACVPTSTR